MTGGLLPAEADTGGVDRVVPCVVDGCCDDDGGGDLNGEFVTSELCLTCLKDDEVRRGPPPPPSLLPVLPVPDWLVEDVWSTAIL